MGKLKAFGGDNYYPQGGYDDFLASADTLEELYNKLVGKSFKWAHIVTDDTITHYWEEGEFKNV